MKFKDNLKKQRNLAKISQENLADKLSVSRQTISKWENGDTYPSTKHIFLLSETFGCGIDDLVGDVHTNNIASDKRRKTEPSHPKGVRNKNFYLLTMGITITLFVLSIGLSLSFTNMNSMIDNQKIAVFDKILDGSFKDSMILDGYTDNKVIGYGVTESDGIFYVKCNLYNTISEEPCSVIIYFCNNGNNYSYKCQYLDDPDYVPAGEYYKIG